MTDTIEAGQEAPKMLVADDDPTIVRLLADRCAKMGFNVQTATNGIQALITANRSLPDILIIDVNMPEVDGLSVCKRLLDPTKKSFDVVVVTGRRDKETVERCEGLGAYYVNKGPDFWNNLESALTEIAPGMAVKIRMHEGRPANTDVRMRPRVLVVDDDPDVQRFLSSRLAKCGVDTLYAPDAVQGYQIACKEGPSVIISDYFMPHGDAYYLLWRLRTTTATENIPVFILSGRRIDEVTEQNLKREICGFPGATKFFKKSFETNELFEALGRFCGFETKSGEPTIAAG